MFLILKKLVISTISFIEILQIIKIIEIDYKEHLDVVDKLKEQIETGLAKYVELKLPEKPQQGK